MAHSTTAVNLGIIQSTMPGMILLGPLCILVTVLIAYNFLPLLTLGSYCYCNSGSLEQLMQLTQSRRSVNDLRLLFLCYVYCRVEKQTEDCMVMLAYFSVAAF